MPLDIQLDDIVQLRKKHPCGSDEWRVVCAWGRTSG